MGISVVMSELKKKSDKTTRQPGSTFTGLQKTKSVHSNMSSQNPAVEIFFFRKKSRCLTKWSN